MIGLIDNYNARLNMEEDIKYSLKLNKFLKYYISTLPILSVIVLLIFVMYAGITNLKLLIGLLLFFTVLRNWFKYFKRPVKIKVFEDYANLYNIFNKETTIKFSDIKSIESNRSQALIIRTKSEKILGVNGFPEFSRFVEDIKNKNKEVVFKGL